MLCTAWHCRAQVTFFSTLGIRFTRATKNAVWIQWLVQASGGAKYFVEDDFPFDGSKLGKGLSAPTASAGTGGGLLREEQNCRFLRQIDDGGGRVTSSKP